MIDNYKKGITMMEVIIAATLSCIIMGIGMAMMSRSNTQFKKSNDLISIQRLMDNIIERIRTDVRSLKRVVPKNVVVNTDTKKKNIITEETPNEISFIVVRYNNSDNEELDEKHRYAKITYVFNPEEKTLYRSEIIGCDEYGGDTENGKEDFKTDFHGARQVISMNFEPIFNSDYDKNGEKKDDADLEKDGDDFKCLNVAMQIASNEFSGKESDASTLSIACQFYSTCVESELRISNLRKE